MNGLSSAEWRSDTHPADRINELEQANINLGNRHCADLDRINALEAEVERLKKTERFLRSERPMARRLTEYEELLERAMKNLESVMLYGPLHADISDALEKKEKP
jgi:hypothetical protein